MTDEEEENDDDDDDEDDDGNDDMVRRSACHLSVQDTCSRILSLNVKRVEYDET